MIILRFYFKMPLLKESYIFKDLLTNINNKRLLKIVLGYVLKKRGYTTKLPKIIIYITSISIQTKELI